MNWYIRRNSGKSGRLPAPSRRSGLSADDQSQDSDLEICDVSRDKMVAPIADSLQVNGFYGCWMDRMILNV